MRRNAAKLVINRVGTMVSALSILRRENVLVGIPQEKNQRRPDGTYEPMNNATLAYIHDNGSPAANIPARPFMRPGVQRSKRFISRVMRAAALDALTGRTSATELALRKVGLGVASEIKNVINEGIAPALKWSTVRNRLYRRTGVQGAKAALKKGGAVPDMADVKPLVATAQMRNSITYVIRKRL
jgi:hypothetical protein